MALAIIFDDTIQKTKSVNSVNYPITKIIPVEIGIKINEVLPFRVRFTTIGIASEYAGIPGIGLQIIGINNYIL
jgi:hypothetical protein